MKNLLCKILTLGHHWWKYYPNEKRYIKCRICGKTTNFPWNIFCKLFSADRFVKRWNQDQQIKIERKVK